MKAYCTLIKNPDHKIKYKKFEKGGREYFHVGVWVGGSQKELSEVEKVEYLLHSTFKNRIRSSKARNNGFSVTFWAWGTFEIEITVYKIDGDTESIIFPLDFELPVDDGTNYVDVSTL